MEQPAIPPALPTSRPPSQHVPARLSVPHIKATTKTLGHIVFTDVKL